MALKKCPKCELNYIRGDAPFCDVCTRELKRIQARNKREEEEHEQEILICTECGEAPAVRGSELCAECLKEAKRQIDLENAATLDEAFDETDDEEQDEE